MGELKRVPAAPREAGSGDLRAVTLDVWYTLVYLRTPARLDLERRRWRTWTDPLVRAGLSRADARQCVGDLMAWQDREESLGRTPPIEEQANWLVRRVGRTVPLDGVPGELDRALLGAPVQVAEDAVPVLERLAGTGVRLGIVSNVRFETGAGARTMLDSVGLLGRVDSVVLSCEQPWSKPSPEPFRWCLGQLGAPPAAAVHIGDLAYDVRGARTAGIEPILFTGLHRWESPRPRLAPVDRPRVSFARWSSPPARIREAIARAPVPPETAVRRRPPTARGMPTVRRRAPARARIGRRREGR